MIAGNAGVLDWIAISALAIFCICVSVLSALEVSHASSGEHDHSHGHQIRRWFMATVSGANAARAISSIADGVYTYMCTMLKVEPQAHLETSISVFPSLLYFTMYSLLAVYFAQLVYTVQGVPFFRVRNVWFFTNLLLYVTVIFSVIFLTSLEYVYFAIFLTYFANLVLIGWYSNSVFNHFPEPTTGRSMSASAASVAKITTKLYPVVVVSLGGLFVNVLHYGMLAFDVIKRHQVVMRVLLFAAGEVGPSIALLYLVSKRSERGEEASLLTKVVETTYSALESSEETKTAKLGKGLGLGANANASAAGSGRI